MIVKVMHKNTGNDEHPRASYRVFSDVKEVDFAEPSPNGHTRPYLYMTISGQEIPTSIELTGNVYLMTDNGKTFDKFEVNAAIAQ